MNSPRVSAVAGDPSRFVNRPTKAWTVRSAPVQRRQVRQVALTRRYEVMYLDDDAQIQDFIRVAPAIPIFEQAFSAFAHGVLINTAQGPVAVEDLVPGMEIETANGGTTTLKWVGAITMVPGAPSASDEPQRLYRITADALGLARPATDATFGPAARLLKRDPAVVNALGAEAALSPVKTMEDGVSVVALNPVSPVRVYHLAFDSHQVIMANGVEVESYHPGPDAHYSMSQELRDLFVSLFPHIDSLQGFGRMMWPRFDSEAHEMYELG
ncbi:MAG: Hint domain-containing protein [Pseudomonadota bacterium]